MSLSKKYTKSKDQKWVLRFRTALPNDEFCDGVVTHIGRSLIVMREMRYFDFDGVVVLPKKNLKGYRDAKYEKCYNRILHFNGNIKKAHTPKWLNSCESMPDILRQIKKRNIWPSVEICFELDGEIKTDFYIGPITQIDGDRFWVHDYNAAGKWGETWDIEFSEILKINFNDRYSTEFNKYMKSL